VSADLLVAGLDQPSRDAIRALARRVMARMGRQAAAEPCLADVMSEGGRGADYLAWRLGDPDAFPGQEQALLHAAANAAGRVVSPQQTVKLAEAWRPFRAHAASFLLLADGRAS
jgi:hypothetical protein